MKDKNVRERVSSKLRLEKRVPFPDVAWEEGLKSRDLVGYLFLESGKSVVVCGEID